MSRGFNTRGFNKLVKPRAFKNPMRQLVMALRSAARYIDVPAARACAKTDAEQIPETWAERLPNTVTGKVAKLARALLLNLENNYAPGHADMTAETLRCFADALDDKSTSNSAGSASRPGRGPKGLVSRGGLRRHE